MTGALSLQALRAANQAREQAEKRREIRRKSLIILVHQYLKEEGFSEAADNLVKEARLNTELFRPYDNISLHKVLEEYESFYVSKFEKFPRLAKRIMVPIKNSKLNTSRVTKKNDQEREKTPIQNRTLFKRTNTPSGRLKSHRTSLPTAEVKREPLKSSSDSDSDKGFTQLQSLSFKRAPAHIIDLRSMINDYSKLEDNIGDIGTGRNRKVNGEAPRDETNDDTNDLLNEKVVMPPATIYSGELKDLANIIQKEILIQNPDVHWNDIIGIEDAKRLLKESTVYPLKYPQLFIGRFKPWRGILLYGPPGTGKTLLAKAVATECKSTFFNISATTLVSKWRGDSEKLVRVLFELARLHSPSTIFIDEVDALMGCRHGEQEHEASRRMKTQLLVELDGLTRGEDHVFLLAASNVPWELDPAMLRRLEKRILVPLPNADSREKMLETNLPSVLSDLEASGQLIKTNLNYQDLANKTDGYSGSDLQVVCREAAMSCLRKVFYILDDDTDSDNNLSHFRFETIEMKDVVAVLQRTKPAQNDSQKYLDWHTKYGSV